MTTSRGKQAVTEVLLDVLFPDHHSPSSDFSVGLKTHLLTGLCFLLGSQLPHPLGGLGAANNWGMYWLLKLPAGLLYWLISYWILGTLFRWLIHQAGGQARSAEARMIFCLTSLPFLFAAAGESLWLMSQYPTPGAAWLEITQPDSLLLLGSTILTLIFSLWGTLLSYQYCRVRFQLNTFWGCLLFLIIPVLLDFAGLAIVLVNRLLMR